MTSTRYYLGELAGRNLAPGTADWFTHQAELAALVEEAHAEAIVWDTVWFRYDRDRYQAQLELIQLTTDVGAASSVGVGRALERLRRRAAKMLDQAHADALAANVC